MYSLRISPLIIYRRIQSSVIFSIGRTISRKPIIIPTSQDGSAQLRQKINSDIKKEKLRFNSVQGINYHLETQYPITDRLWKTLINQILIFNKDKIIEVQQQELFNEQLYQFLKSSKKLDDKLIELICEMCNQYRKHNFDCDQVKQIRQFIFNNLEDYIENLDLNTLVKISYLVNHYLFNNFDQLKIKNQLLIHNISRLITNNPNQQIEFNNLKEIYNLLDNCRKDNIQYQGQQMMIPIIEVQIIRFANIISKPVNMLLKVYQSLSFTHKKYNSDVMGVLINRSCRLIHEMTTNEIIFINNKQNSLKITDPVWFTLITKYSIELIVKLEQSSQKIQSEEQKIEMKDQTSLLPEEYELLSLAESISGVQLNNQCLQTAIDSFVELEGYFVIRFSKLSQKNQLILVKQHSILLEALHRQQQDIQDLSKRGPKKVKVMNIRFYELIIDQLKQLSFSETVQFLEYASVLGITKRKVCQQIIKKGLEGLSKYEQKQIDENTGYLLLNYYKLLRMFITHEDELIQIDMAFNDIKVNVIQLLTDYGHYAIRRDKIENSIKLIE